MQENGDIVIETQAFTQLGGRQYRAPETVMAAKASSEHKGVR